MSTKPFIHDNFMLIGNQAEELYHQYAVDLPIIDYHCHLPPDQIANDQRWENITQLWLYNDHYKWRAMRSGGIAERYCTGEGSDREKFDKYAELMPKAICNPIYHWTHLELKQYFGISDLLNPSSCDDIWHKTKEAIISPEFSARELMTMSNVQVVCTTDDPVDSLQYHIAIEQDPNFNIQVRPTWRPDKSWMVNDSESFHQWVDKLEIITGSNITDLDSYMSAIKQRHDFFHSVGCRLSDRGLDQIWADSYSSSEIYNIFTQARSTRSLTTEQVAKFKSFMLHELAVMDANRGWTMQIHYGVLRNTNSRLMGMSGVDIGCDSIGQHNTAEPMAKHFNRLETIGKLPKTIIYPINSSHNEMVATMIGNFQDGQTAGKMQFGSGWWFMDQIDGMTKQLRSLSQLGLLSQFVGMLTDSRSFLSYPRHQYFRRLLCNMLGNDMALGLIPDDIELVGNIISNICYNNSRNYFGFFED